MLWITAKAKWPSCCTGMIPFHPEWVGIWHCWGVQAVINHHSATQRSLWVTDGVFSHVLCVSYLFNLPVCHVAVWGWLKSWSESKGKTLASACPAPSTTCSVSVVLATNPSRWQSQAALGWSQTMAPESNSCQAPTPRSHQFKTNNRRNWLQSTSPCQPFPSHSLIQGRWGRGLTPPSSHPLQPHQWNTGKYRSTQNIGMKPRKYYSIPQIHFSYCLRWSLLLGYCDTVKFMGNRLTPSTPKRRGTINTSLFLILLPSAFGLFSSTFLLYPPIIATAKYNQHLSFFSRQPLREQKASPGWTLAVPSSSSRLQCSAPQAEICCSH